MPQNFNEFTGQLACTELSISNFPSTWTLMLQRGKLVLVHREIAGYPELNGWQSTCDLWVFFTVPPGITLAPKEPKMLRVRVEDVEALHILDFSLWRMLMLKGLTYPFFFIAKGS